MGIGKRALVGLVMVGVAGAPLIAIPTPSGAREAESVAATFDDAPVGAAAGVTGGDGGEVRVVTTLADSGAGSLREAAEEPGPAVVVFAVSGDIPLRKAVEVGSDLTIDGRGADVTLVGTGLVISGQENVIVRNLRIHGNEASDSNDDAIGIQGATVGVWIDHVDLASFQDGLVDVTQGATDVTISWSHLHDHGKAMLIGSNVRQGAPDLVDVTLHHNHIERTGERNPLVRQGRVHVVNNVLEAWGYAADSGYGVRSDCGGQVLVEANVFRPGANLRAVQERQEGCDEQRPALLRAVGNDPGGAEVREAGADSVEITDDQGVVPEPVGDALLTAVRDGAGWQDVPNPLPIEVPSPPDGDDPDSVDAGPDRDGDSDSDRGDDGFQLPSPLAIAGVGVAGVALGMWIGRRRKP